MAQKWIYEQGLYYPVTGETTLHNTPGYGVFNVEASSSDSNRIGLRRIADEFTFDFKIYDLGCEDIFSLVEDRWNSPSFKESGRNLGVIFNGLKGTGKTIAAKILSNRLRIPVVIVSNSQPGLVDCIQSIEFECVVLVDEAEKMMSKSLVLQSLPDFKTCLIVRMPSFQPGWNGYFLFHSRFIHLPMSIIHQSYAKCFPFTATLSFFV